MSRPQDDREGLSPPAPNILDLFEGDDDDEDDVYEPVTEESDLATTTEEDSEGEFAGQKELPLDIQGANLCVDAQENLSGIEVVFENEDGEEEGEATETEAGSGTAGEPRATQGTVYPRSVCGSS